MSISLDTESEELSFADKYPIVKLGVHLAICIPYNCIPLLGFLSFMTYREHISEKIKQAALKNNRVQLIESFSSGRLVDVCNVIRSIADAILVDLCCLRALYLTCAALSLYHFVLTNKIITQLKQQPST